MANVLIVQGHPDPAGTQLCHAIAHAHHNAAEANGHTVERIDVAHEDIPYLRSATDWERAILTHVAATGQAAITKADHIVLIYPLWMGDMTALLKSWIEQVLRPAFAFKQDGARKRGALIGKSARAIVTMGMPGFVYKWFFLAHFLRNLVRNILKFSGRRPVRWSIFGNAEDPSRQAQKRFLANATQLGRAAQ